MLCKYLAAAVLFPLLICLCATSQTGILIPEEVETLKRIGIVLGKRDWDFSVDPCSGLRNWSTPINGDVSDATFANQVNCSNCSVVNNISVCHVTSIALKSQNLQGTLPKEFIGLPYLNHIDLTRNYLNGTIPAEWGSTQLSMIVINSNRLSGTIPKELGNISTLTQLVLEFNQLSGTIPPEIGNLPRLKRLVLTSNNLTGELPGTLAKLSTLTDFRVGDNNFVGSIPNFIENWTNIQKLMIQGSGLNGPIPTGISLFTNLIDLRISDLGGGNASSIPNLSRATKLKTLILRSCNIVGDLPDYFGKLASETNFLVTVDLSFNNLSGQIHGNFDGNSNKWKLNYIYLTGNSLTGQVPESMLKSNLNIDLSYNNFTYSSNNCQESKTNLFFSSSGGNTSGIVSCLKSHQCPKKRYYSLYINCGGEAVNDNKNTNFEEDSNTGGPSTFYQSKTHWFSSSTGHFLDVDNRGVYILKNTSQISSNNNPILYTTARISPLSLTYYAVCLANGSYTVNLHFAEIMFTNDTTFYSLGRRIFDIYIQRKLVWKDFNIEDKAGGVNMGVVIPFNATVIDTTLEIRFYWAGKGTNAVPEKGVYGPLISAISVKSNFPVPAAHQSLSVGAIVGIVIGVIFSISLLLFVLWWKGCLCNKNTIANDLRGLELQTGTFTLREIKVATNNFDEANKIGEGGFGPVYKGDMPDGRVIAVKQLSAKSKQGNREFLNEIGMISAIQHPNLVKLYGCCIEANQLLLVYEYLENNSLARTLFGPEEHQLKLDWKTRHKICVGIARGLAYLHEESRLKIVHRDIKATNVLLDKNLNPKISDFGLAKLDEEDNTHMSTRIAGTFGYMAPEYAMRGHLSDKADVYSFGVVLLEVVSGKSNTNNKPKKESFYLLDWANVLQREGRLMELVDERLGSNFNKKEVMATINIALLCTNATANCRPNMSSVVSMLEHGVVDHEKLVSESSLISTTEDETESLNPKEKMESISMNISWTTNSGSTDLYPISVETKSGR